MSGYIFTGWTTDDVTVICGKFTMPKKDVVFTGTWTKVSYDVSYHYSGYVPSGAPSLPSTSSYEWGTTGISVADNPTMNYYTFSGWTTDDTTVTNGTFTMPKKNVVFTGCWSKSKYSVTYQYIGTVPSGAPALPSGGSYTWGTTNIPVASKPSMSGYIFTGWTTDDVTVICGKFTMPKKDVVFTGTWTKVSYDVSYEYTGTVPSGAPALPSTSSYAWGTEDVAVEATPTLAGYIFNGWTTDDATVTDGTFTMPQSNVVFTGSWTKIPYNVTYQYTGTVPSNAPTLPTGGIYEWGTEGITVEADLSLEGYTFSGWVTDDVTVAGGSFTMPQNHVVFTATWAKIPYKVTYQYTGTVPSGAPALPSDESHDWGTENITVATAPTMEGYTFSGWATGDVTVTSGTFTMPQKDVVFTATWAENEVPKTGDTSNILWSIIIMIVSVIGSSIAVVLKVLSSRKKIME